MRKVEEVVNETLAAHGVNQSAIVEPVVQKPSFEAFTKLTTNQTTLRYNPEFKLPANSKSFASRKSVVEPLEVCVRDVTAHECGHVHNKKRSACPETLEQHEEHFYEPAARELKSKGKLGAVDSVTNLVEDLIDNTLLSQDAHAGLSLFYKDVAVTIGWKPAYEAYMRIQLYCWGDFLDKKLLTKHFSSNPDVIKATQEFLRTLEAAHGVKIQEPYKTGKEFARAGKEFIVNYFADKNNWKTITTQFVTALEPLIPPSLEIPMCGFGKQMREEMSDPTNRERFARKRYTAGKSRPAWMDKEEALDAVYSSLAREIKVKVEAPRKATSMPVVPFQHEPFNPEEHSLRQINFRKPMIIAEKDTPFGLEGLTFGVPEQYIEKPLLVKKGITSFPEFKCAYIDCSISMTEGIPDSSNPGSTSFIPWGDKSKYHYLCKAWYGIIEYLARQQILPNVNVTLGAFSDTSRVRSGLENAKRLLFNPQFGGTTMDTKAIEKLFAGGKSVFFTVSDGDIENWKAVKDDFIAKAREQYFFHIQIGKHTDMSKDLKRAGLPVYKVTSGDDLERMAVDLTQNAYQSYIHDVLELSK